MPSESISFQSPLGHQLSAKLELPASEPKAYALFAHCFACSKDLKAAVRIARALADQGVAVLRFDFTGLGQSEGEFADSTFSANIGDLLAAAQWLRDHRRAPEILIGHSLGGAAVLVGAAKIPEVKAVATIGAPSSTEHLKKGLEAQTPDLKPGEDAVVDLGGRPFTVQKSFIDDLAGDSVCNAASSLGKALIVFHSPTDNVVGIEHAGRIYTAAKHPKSFVALDGADHLLLNRASDATFVAAMLAPWAGRYVDYQTRDARSTLEPNDVLVRGGPRGFANDVFTSRHHLLADEPTRVPGGTDTGPSPYDYVLAGLGACTSMTLRMYADRKKWPLTGVDVKLTHKKIHAADCVDCETTEGKLDEIDREVTLHGDLDDTQRKRLIDIADKCPVHRTLHSEIKVRTRQG